MRGWETVRVDRVAWGRGYHSIIFNLVKSLVQLAWFYGLVN